MTYDADRRPLTATAPAPFSNGPGLVQTSNEYDPDGHLVSVTRANGASPSVTSLSYTPTGQVQTVTDPNGNVTTNAYDADDRLANVTDPLFRRTVYAYDAMSRRISVSNPAISSSPLLQQTYTPDGLIASLTDANNNTTSFTPDGFDRLSTTTYPNSSTEVLSYDADGNVLTRQTRAGSTITLTYDTLNRLATKAAPSEPSVTYAYDQASHLIGVSDNSASMVAPSASASYSASYTYDQLNRPLTATWSPAPAQSTPVATRASFNFTYDQTNRRIAQAATDNSWWSYPTTATNVSYTANNLNQYTTVGSVGPTYDGNGNLTYDGTFTYCYDTENRLVSVLTAGTCSSPTTTLASYAYDAQSRRKSKTVSSTTTIYITDADNREVLEYNGSSGAIQNWYAYALGPNDILNQMNVASGTRATFVPDILGSFVGSLDATSGALSKFGYQTYGESNSANGSFGYTGQRIDPESNGLYYYRARHYMPAWGRFMQVDPIGYAGRSHLYRYVRNDPLNLTDPYGLAPDSPTPEAGGNGQEPPPVAAAAAAEEPENDIGNLILVAENGPGVGSPSGQSPEMEELQSEEQQMLGGGGPANTANGGGVLVPPPPAQLPGGWGGGSGAGGPLNPFNLLYPGGNPIGTPGGGPGIQNVPGGMTAAQQLFNNLTQGGVPYNPASPYPGTLYQLPGGGFVGLRPVSGSGGPAIDVNIPGIGITRLHF